MKLLLDANISWRLIAKLENNFDDCFHVDHIGLKIPASDIEIWAYAKGNGLIIVTNDDDFLNLINTKGFPPKIVLLRMGNQRNQYIEQIPIKHKPDIVQLLQSTETGVLEIH
jgi:predicted nuclease of predicted toxin-antitoxin system